MALEVTVLLRFDDDSDFSVDDLEYELENYLNIDRGQVTVEVLDIEEDV